MSTTPYRVLFMGPDNTGWEVGSSSLAAAFKRGYATCDAGDWDDFVVCDSATLTPIAKPKAVT